MKISDERETRLYRAVTDPITDLRLKYYREFVGARKFDEEMFWLENEIWSRVTDVLKLNSSDTP